MLHSKPSVLKYSQLGGGGHVIYAKPPLIPRRRVWTKAKEKLSHVYPRREVDQFYEIL
jgi:hypothetical protein